MSKEWFYKFFEHDYFRINPNEVDQRIEEAVPKVESLIDVLDIKPDDSILDLCCGYGRLTIPFARRGYNITGYDLCKKALDIAREKIEAESLQMHLVRGDMRELGFENEFDVIYNFFTSFGYFEHDSEDLKVLEGVSRSLKDQGRFLIDYINGPRILKQFQEKIQEDLDDRLIIHENTYDEKSKRIKSKWTFVYKNTEESNEYLITNRLYSINELTDMLGSVGLEAVNTYGDMEKTSYDENSRRIIVVAQKA